MKRLVGNYLNALFDYQRFLGNPSLATLIEETAQRRLSNDVDFFVLPDEAIRALYGAGGTRDASLCPYCGAVLPDAEALRQHIADTHQP